MKVLTITTVGQAALRRAKLEVERRHMNEETEETFQEKNYENGKLLATSRENYVVLLDLITTLETSFMGADGWKEAKEQLGKHYV